MNLFNYIAYVLFILPCRKTLVVTMDPGPCSSKRREGDDAEIEPAGVLQQKKTRIQSEPNLSLCLICQQKSNRALRNASEDGKEKLFKVANERKMLHDTNSIERTERIIGVLKDFVDDDEDVQVEYHHTCYSSFTHEKYLNKLRKTKKSDDKMQEPQDQTKSRRCMSDHYTDWNLCMFCQEGNDCQKGKMRNVRELGFSTKILNLSQRDTTMRVRLSNVSDLIAAEGKYHFQCWVEFQRKVEKLSAVQNDGNDKHMDRLCYQLLRGLSHGYVYDMGDVWSDYKEMCDKDSIPLPQRYISRRSSFYDDIEKRVGPQASFVRPLNQYDSLIMYPTDKYGYVTAKSLKSTINRFDDDASLGKSEEDNVSRPQLQQSSILQGLVHTALKIRKDLEDTPGHSAGWGGIDQEHVDKVIPTHFTCFSPWYLVVCLQFAQRGKKMNAKTQRRVFTELHKI